MLHLYIFIWALVQRKKKNQHYRLQSKSNTTTSQGILTDIRHRFQEKFNFFFFPVMTILFYFQVRKYIEKLEQRLWHSLTSGTAINNLNTTTLPNQKYNKQTDLPLLLQPSNCAHNLVLTAAPPIPAVIARISPST